jgi:uncharacterized protein YihD (DUF1040 family)
MRDKTRIPKILKEIEKIWVTQPDLRLGQLLGNIIREPSLYYIEDEELIKILKKGYEKNKTK